MSHPGTSLSGLHEPSLDLVCVPIFSFDDITHVGLGPITLNTLVKTLFPNIKCGVGCGRIFFGDMVNLQKPQLLLLLKNQSVPLATFFKATCLVSLNHQCYEKLQGNVEE